MTDEPSKAARERAQRLIESTSADLHGGFEDWQALGDAIAAAFEEYERVARLAAPAPEASPACICPFPRETCPTCVFDGCQACYEARMEKGRDRPEVAPSPDGYITMRVTREQYELLRRHGEAATTKGKE